MSGGVQRVAGTPEAIADDLAAAGWRVGVVGGAGDRRAALVEIGRALGFPRHYGANLDALWDCLTDLRAPTAVVWAGWADLAVDHPRDWAAVLDVLAERGEQEPAFAVVLVDAGAGDRPAGVSP